MIKEFIDNKTNISKGEEIEYYDTIIRNIEKILPLKIMIHQNSTVEKMK